MKTLSDKFKYLNLVLLVVAQMALAFASNAWSSEPEPININTATAEQMAETLKGVGVKKANDIVEFRQAVGKITSDEQLTEVKGIGEKTVAQNKGLIKYE